MFRIFLCIHLATVLFGRSAGVCPDATIKCACEGSNSSYTSFTRIECRNRRITSIGDQLKLLTNDCTKHITIDELVIASNNVSNIAANDFCRITARKVNISDNHIRNIHDMAFKNLNTTTELYIQKNNLAFLPPAFKDLNMIKVLDVRDNPENTTNSIALTDAVMKETGDTLESFSFGSAGLSEWPTSLHHLQGLKHLTLDKTMLNHLAVVPPTAFDSFRSTLETLDIRNTHLKAVPLGISDLRRIKTLHFDHNHEVSDGGIVIQALFQKGRPTITELSLIDDNLSKFPRALFYMKALKSLTMNNNNLQYISDESVTGLNITTLVLKHCNLERIPGVLVDLVSLNILDLSHNQIINVERSDVDIMKNLTSLDLSHNPLKFISTNAFNKSRHLSSIVMTNTNLTEIPLALKNSTSIRNVDLSNSNIECMCEYVWLTYKTISIKGECGNIYQTFCTYIRDFIPRCPGYRGGTVSVTCKGTKRLLTNTSEQENLQNTVLETVIKLKNVNFKN